MWHDPHQYWLSNATTCVTYSMSPPTPESPVSVDLFPLRFLMSVNLQIALVMLSRECPFFLFPLEWDGSACRFSACLWLWASLGVSSSSTSSTLSVLTLTCTPDDRKAASSSLSLFVTVGSWLGRWNLEETRGCVWIEKPAQQVEVFQPLFLKVLEFMIDLLTTIYIGLDDLYL